MVNFRRWDQVSPDWHICYRQIFDMFAAMSEASQRPQPRCLDTIIEGAVTMSNHTRNGVNASRTVQ